MPSNRRLTRRKALVACSGAAMWLPGSISPGALGESRSRRVELDAVDEVEEQHETSFDVSVTEPLVTDEHPSFVRIAITNEGSARDVSTTSPEEHLDLLFAPYEEGRSDPRNLILRLASVTDESDGPRDGNGRWSVDPPDGAGAAGAGQWTFPSGKTIARKFRLLDDADFDDYYPPGTYRFETDFSFRSVDDGELVNAFDWGFSLIVSRE